MLTSAPANKQVDLSQTLLSKHRTLSWPWTIIDSVEHRWDNAVHHLSETKVSAGLSAPWWCHYTLQHFLGLSFWWNKKYLHIFIYLFLHLRASICLVQYDLWLLQATWFLDISPRFNISHYEITEPRNRSLTPWKTGHTSNFVSKIRGCDTLQSLLCIVHVTRNAWLFLSLVQWCLVS